MLLSKSFKLTISSIEQNIFKIYISTVGVEDFISVSLQQRKIMYLFLPHAVLFTFPFETGT